MNFSNFGEGRERRVCRSAAETIYIDPVVYERLMVPVVADIANLEAGVLADLLLNLQAVLQIDGVFDVWVNVKDAGRREPGSTAPMELKLPPAGYAVWKI